MGKLDAVIGAMALILCGQQAHAGVVMSETEVRSGLGTSVTLHKTIYVQGNKQKRETKDEQIITDLDKGVVYRINPRLRSYSEANLVASPPAAGTLTVFDLRRTGLGRAVHGYSCQEYRGSQKLGVLDVTMSMCMSKDMPGTEEITTFQNELILRLVGSSAPKVPSVPLEQRSTIKLRTSQKSSDGKSESGPSMTTDTQVKGVYIMNLPPETFQPPAGFRKQPASDEEQQSV
jgi:hypothetical protein